VAEGKPFNLSKFREEINDIDRKIVEDLALRFGLVQKVLSEKEVARLTLRDKKRETELLGEVVKVGRSLGLDAYFLTRVFQEIIDYSLKLQKSELLEHQNGKAKPEIIRVAFQGIDEAYSHLAARKYFSQYLDRTTFRGCPTFAEVIEVVEDGGADYGILPVENTTAGSINEVYDLLLRTRLSIVGEEIYEVVHCLSSVADVSLANIRRIYSHPQALAQCSNFLATLQNCHIESFVDTAEAVKKVKQDQDLAEAAIASEEAALAHGLVILKRGIANQKQNYTRFFVLAAEPVRVDARIPAKTSMVLATAHKEGALARCLNSLAVYHLNMTKLESRPRPNTPWEYLFYVDVDGNIVEENMQRAIEELKRESTFLKVLGTYPALDRDRSTPSVVDLVIAEPDDEEEKPHAPAVATKKGYRLVTRAHKEEDTVLGVRGIKIGGGSFTVIAGPCAVESEEQIRRCARAVKEHGGHVLRGGCFKPRTSPYSFQGLGYEGLNYLVRAGEDFGLPVVTEVLTPGDVNRVAQQADILQIGARNMQNFSLLNEVGRIDRPVVLKRGLMSSIEELLGAAEYILAQGNQQVILCERGIRTFETATRNTLDLSAVPILKEQTHLPVIVDPSHAAGARSLVPPLARAARSVGADGIMVEMHPDPENARSDGPQSLTFAGFKRLMADLVGKRL
jgi:chorismate mutase/prephenate dehydratase